MTDPFDVGLASGFLAFSLVLAACGQAAPSTRRVVAVVNEAGDPSFERVRELADRYPQGQFRLRHSTTPDFTRDFKNGGPLRNEPLVGEATLSWNVASGQVAVMVRRLRAERYVLVVTVSGN